MATYVVVLNLKSRQVGLRNKNMGSHGITFYFTGRDQIENLINKLQLAVHEAAALLPTIEEREWEIGD